MNIFLLVLFCLVLAAALVLSFVSKNIFKKDRYLLLSLYTASMMILFYWDNDNLLILIASALLLLSLSFGLFYFLIFKPFGIEGLKTLAYNTKENKVVDTIISIIIVVLPISTKSELIVAIALITYLIYDRYMFYRRFSSLF